MWRVLPAVSALALSGLAQAAPGEPVESSSGVWTRPTLSGDWGGARRRLAERGVTFDLSLTQVGQAVVDGGKDTGWEDGGRGDLVASLDTEKLGLWPGGLFTVEVEGNFGADVNARTGALMEVNSNQLYPIADLDGVGVPAVMLTHHFSRKLGVIVGKVQTGSDANEFAAGKGDVQFLNIAFSFNAAALLTMPYSALGVGVILSPTGDDELAKLQLFAVDADGKGNSAGFDTAFDGATTYHAEGRVRTLLFGLTGHQLIGGTYSTKSFTALDQNVRLVVEDRSLRKKDGSWCLYYNFDQYLYETEDASGHGLGVFGRFGMSDGNPNPVKYFYSAGIGGRGIVPGRPLDSFGIGYYYVSVGDPSFAGPFATRSFLGDEQGAEAYYSFAITPWLKLSPDIQLVRPAQRQAATGEAAGGDSSVKHVDRATVLGVRLQLVI
jgi:porin